MRRILVIHYTPPGVIGGVEHIIHQHIDLLRRRNFEVIVAAGRDGMSGVPIEVIPQIEVARPENAIVEDRLAEGVVAPEFSRIQESIRERLKPLVRWADTVIAHNAFTLHFSLPLTSVLWELAEDMAPGRMIAWCHDLAWTNPLYLPGMHTGFPWELLRRPAPNTTYVTVSEERRIELAGLWGGPGDGIVVVPNGIDVAGFLRLSPSIQELAERYGLYDRDLVLLLPVRITRRKNIEAAIPAVRALKDRGLDVRFLISGPTAPHHPGRSHTYLEKLEAIRTDFSVEEEVVFLTEALGRNLEDDEVAELYLLADALLFPSAQEGFGLPIIEAGLARVPVVVSDIPIFREIAGRDATKFELDDPADTIAAKILAALDTGQARLYRRAIRDYRWDAIMDSKILPLLAASPLEARASPRDA